MKQNKKLEFFLFSAVGIAVMFFIVVALNVISSAAKVRIDMTENKMFTLSDGTKSILSNLEGPVEIRLYVSSGGARLPSTWQSHARSVEDLIREFEDQSNGAIEVKKFDPQPDTDEEDLARLDGIQGQPNPGTGDSFYLGVAISQDPEKEVLPIIPPNRAELLEYDLIRAVSTVTATKKTVLGIMTPLPLFGQQVPPQLAAQMGQQNQQPWVILRELKKDMEVREIPMTSESIEDDVDVLMLVHPRDISEAAQYAVDQFLMRGGKVFALLDAKSVVDRPQGNNNPMAAMMGGGASNLDKLLSAWGVKFETTQVVADMNFSREVSFQRGAAPQAAPALLFLNKEALNPDDVVTSQIDNLLLPFAGSFTGDPKDGIEKTVLLHSSTKSQLVDPMTAQFSGQKIVDEFDSSDTEHALAVRLKGKFKTAFPNGKPSTNAAPGEASAPAGDGSLKETTDDGVVILVGDSDFVYDNFCVQVIPLFNIVQPINGNLVFVQNLLEQLGGDINLIGARSRATSSRPFTVVQQKETEARERFQSEIKKLQDEKAEAESRLSELQARKTEGQERILSQEQLSEIEEFQKKQADANKRLRQVQKDLRKEIVSLESQLKLLNIAGMPIVVVIVGIGLAIVRKKRTRAK